MCECFHGHMHRKLCEQGGKKPGDPRKLHVIEVVRLGQSPQEVRNTCDFWKQQEVECGWEKRVYGEWEEVRSKRTESTDDHV